MRSGCRKHILPLRALQWESEEEADNDNNGFECTLEQPASGPLNQEIFTEVVVLAMARKKKEDLKREVPTNTRDS